MDFLSPSTRPSQALLAISFSIMLAICEQRHSQKRYNIAWAWGEDGVYDITSPYVNQTWTVNTLLLLACSPYHCLYCVTNIMTWLFINQFSKILRLRFVSLPELENFKHYSEMLPTTADECYWNHMDSILTILFWKLSFLLFIHCKNFWKVMFQTCSNILLLEICKWYYQWSQNYIPCY